MKGNRLFVLACLGISAFSLFAAAPPLSIQQLPNSQLQLTWPGTAAGFILEQADSLSAPVAWQSVGAAAVNNGGVFSVTIPSASQTRFYRLRGGLPATVLETSPAAGESGVAVTRETIFRLSAPLAADATLTTSQLFAEYGGRRLLSRAEIAGDRRTVTLFYLENLPASARLRVSFVGDGVKDANGLDLDADGDGQAGGTGVWQFDTASITALPNTAVIGKVFASELGASGTNRPLAGVIVTVDGAEETLRATTDSSGAFKLSPAPAGRFFVHVDGRTAVGSQWPGGAYYPFVGKAWDAVPGRTNNLAGGSGEVFLPLIQADALKAVSASAETRVTFAPSLLATNPALAGVEIMVPANALFSDNGTRGGKVGMAPVPPDRLPEPLPPGLNMPLVITIQTDGGSNFDVPVPVKFPNLPDPKTGVKLGPGAKTALWSFSHDTGRWEIQGTMTISADGNFAVSDPGVGIRQPGWHGGAPGSRGGGPSGGGGGPPPPPGECEGAFDCDNDGCYESMEECPAEDCDKWLKEINRLTEDCSIQDATRDQRDAMLCGLPFIDCPDPAWKKKLFECRDQLALAKLNYIRCVNGGALSALPRAGLRLAAFAADPRLVEQRALTAAAATPVNLLLGSPQWTEVEPRELDVWAALFTALADAAQPASPVGAQINDAERATILALPLPTNLTPALVQNAITRLNAYRANTLPASERTQIDNASAAYAALWAQYQARGWRTTSDGYYQIDAELSAAAAPLSAKTFAGNRRLFFRMTDLATGFEIRGRLNSIGRFENLILAPETYYAVSYLDPVTGATGDAVFRTVSSGLESSVPAAPMTVPTGLTDSDGDGLADVLESIPGTRAALADTDGDSAGDFAELQSGSDPTDGTPQAQGVVAAADTAGTALGVCVLGNHAFVADTSGLVVFELDGFKPPVLVAQLTTGGASQAIAGAGNTVALGYAQTLVLVDVSNPAAPVLLQKLNMAADVHAVAVQSGQVAVALQNGDLVFLYAETGLEQQRIVDLDGRLEDVQFAGNRLFVLSSVGLIALERSQGQWSPAGRITVPGGTPPLEIGRKLAVNGDLAWVGYFTGFTVVNVSQSAAMMIVGTPPRTQAAVHDFAVASPTTLAVVTSFGGEQSLAVSLYDVRNPASTTNFVTSFETGGTERALTLHRGAILVAAGTSGLQIVNFLAPDFETNPPVVSVSGRFQPNPPRQESGAPFTLIATATDDRFVSHVEFYVDGQRVAVDGNHPFEAELRAPPLTATQPRFTVQARAFDLAGNSTWSSPLMVDLSQDQTAPVLIGFRPTGLERFLAGSEVPIQARFDEPMNAATVSAGFKLVHLGADEQPGTGDDKAVAVTVVALSPTEYVFQTAGLLDVGVYQASLGTNVTDAAGNRIPQQRAWSFRVQTQGEFLGGANAAWSANPATSNLWSFAHLPTVDDFVRINPPASPAVRVQGGVSAYDLLADSPLVFESGSTLRLGRQAVFNGPLTLFTAVTWQGGSVLLGGETQVIGPSRFNLNDVPLENAGRLTFVSSAALNLLNTPDRLTLLRNRPGATWEMTDTAVALQNGTSGPVDFVNEGTLITRGEFNSIATTLFRNLGSVEVRGGLLQIAAGHPAFGASQHLGNYRVDAGATLEFRNTGTGGNGVHEFGRLSRIFGDGNVNLANATLPGSFEANGTNTITGNVIFNGRVKSSGFWRIQRLGGQVTFSGLSPELTGRVDVDGAMNVAVQPAMQMQELRVYGDLTVTTALEVNGPLRLDSSVPGAAARLLGAGRLRANGPLTFAGNVRVGPAALASGVLEIGGTAASEGGANVQIGNGQSGFAVTVLPGGTLNLNGISINQRGSLVNAGTLLKTAGGESVLNGTFQNQGEARVTAGTLVVQEGMFVQTGGSTTLGGGSLTVRRPGGSIADVSASLRGGVLTGAGVFTCGSITNLARIAPGLPVGILDFQVGTHPTLSKYQQGATGVLALDINGAAPGTGHDQLKVSGRALLSGALELTTGAGFDPAVGQEFTILTAASVVGTFATVTGTTLPGGKRFNVVYEAAGVKLRVAVGP